MVVEGRVEAQLAGHPRHLVGRPGRAHDGAGPEQPGHLSGGRADRPGGAGHEHRLPVLHRSDAGEPDVRRQPGHAEHAQVGGGGHPLHVHDPDLRGGQQGVLAPAGLVQHRGADRHGVVAGGQHLAHRAAVHRGVQPERRQVGLGVVHPAAHVGVHGQERVAHQHLAGSWVGQLGVDRAEVVVVGPAEGAGGEMDLPRGRGHGPILPPGPGSRQVPQITSRTASEMWGGRFDTRRM